MEWILVELGQLEPRKLLARRTFRAICTLLFYYVMFNAEEELRLVRDNEEYILLIQFGGCTYVRFFRMRQ